MVEHQLPKLRAAGSNPVFRSKKRMMQIIRFFCIRAAVASLLAKGGTGYKKRGCVSIPSFFESAPAASGKGMRSPQGEHNPARADGMPEAKSRGCEECAARRASTIPPGLMECRSLNPTSIH